MANIRTKLITKIMANAVRSGGNCIIEVLEVIPKVRFNSFNTIIYKHLHNKTTYHTYILYKLNKQVIGNNIIELFLTTMLIH